MFNKDNGEIAKHGISRITRQAFVAVTGTTIQLTEYQELAYISGAAVAGTVYLPPVAQCAGKIFTVICTSVATGSVTVAPFTGAGAADSALWDGGGGETSLVLSAANGYVTFYCTGDRWIVIGMDLDAS